MKIIFKISLLSSFVYLVGCSGSTSEDTTNESTETTPTQTEQTQSIMPEQVPAAEGASTEEVALNPPHGQPGHVCEIPVGAPLNSAPANTMEGSNQIQSTPGQQTQEGTVAEGINPPHGQPGHDCNIPVGAPLNK